MRRLKTRQQFQGMMANTPIARTRHFVLHQMPVVAWVHKDPTAAHTHHLPVLDYADAQRACVKHLTNTGIRSTDHIWLGTLLPKRWAKHAVTRNLIHRQIVATITDLLSVTATDMANKQQPMAYLVRMRSGFHPPGKHSSAPSKPKSKRVPVASKVEAPKPAGNTGIEMPLAAPLLSASSRLLKMQVRQELYSLFSQVERVSRETEIQSKCHTDSPSMTGESV